MTDRYYIGLETDKTKLQKRLDFTWSLQAFKHKVLNDTAIKVCHHPTVDHQLLLQRTAL